MTEREIIFSEGITSGIELYKVKYVESTGGEELEIVMWDGDRWYDPIEICYYLTKEEAIEMAKAILKAFEEEND